MPQSLKSQACLGPSLGQVASNLDSFECPERSEPLNPAQSSANKKLVAENKTRKPSDNLYLLLIAGLQREDIIWKIHRSKRQDLSRVEKVCHCLRQGESRFFQIAFQSWLFQGF